MARDARKRTTKRRGLQIGLGIPALILVVFFAVRIFGDEDTTTNGSLTDASSTTAISDLESTTTAFTPPAGITATAAVDCPATDGSSERYAQFAEAPQTCIDPAKTYTVVVDTSKGSYTAVLDAAKAPVAVNSFVFLARYHFFDGTICHRIIPNFVIQCGDPTATGSGGPGYSFEDELPAAGEYKVGSLAMANSGANTNGSQFFVISGDDGVKLPPQYTLFGQVTDGLDTVTALDAVGTAGAGTPSETVTINSVTVTES